MAAAAAGDHQHEGRVLIGGLAAPQTIGYGTCYYAGAVLPTPLAAELNTSTASVTGAFTASILTRAALAVPVGRWLHRRGGRTPMTAGSATAASLDEAAFAVVINTTPPHGSCWGDPNL
ncbi:hypothetical protein GCM10010124_14210 [Pilimelia terevasa]|uniref:Uncharacterized protein n=1 Tax=Pilimelia terevasa TaxID=53372 RepID=A0A8J3FG30_9ACTN|nr:hypothetical protein [Pilimelia terevasa]GGK22811.1 hypothetical protein GCM10010124_14210 [Pilimelia terevasa]